jgi:hypothetical protein
MSKLVTNLVFSVPKEYNKLIYNYCEKNKITPVDFFRDTTNKCIDIYNNNDPNREYFTNFKVAKSFSKEFAELISYVMDFYNINERDCLRYGLYEVFKNPVITPRMKELIERGSANGNHIITLHIPKYMADHIEQIQHDNTLFGITPRDIILIALTKIIELYELDKDPTRYSNETVKFSISTKNYKTLGEMGKAYGNITLSYIVKNKVLFTVFDDFATNQLSAQKEVAATKPYPETNPFNNTKDSEKEIAPRNLGMMSTMRDLGLCGPNHNQNTAPAKKKFSLTSIVETFDNPKVKDVFAFIIRNADIAEKYVSECEAKCIVKLVCNIVNSKYTEAELLEFANR